jgi:hypothetical protein
LTLSNSARASGSVGRLAQPPKASPTMSKAASSVGLGRLFGTVNPSIGPMRARPSGAASVLPKIDRFANGLESRPLEFRLVGRFTPCLGSSATIGPLRKPD